MKVGEKFGKLEVKEIIKGRKNNFICDCGSEKLIDKYDVERGKINSCGCIRKNKPNALKHGLWGHKLYMIHKSMKQRCYNSNQKDYKNYGGRGILICKEWLDDFMNFYNWSIQNGWISGMKIDRVDNDKGYSPNNCKWTNQKEQSNNIRRNRLIEYLGKSQTLQQWSEELNIGRNTISTRLKAGWNIERALSEKAVIGKNQYE